MTRLYDKLVIAAFVAVACVPIAARFANVRDHGVYGALPRAPRPKPSLASVRDESFQTAYTAWFESWLGLKGYSIYLDNTVLYHAVRDTKPGSTVHIGDDDVLFLYEDFVYYNARADELVTEPIDRYAGKLAALQTRLAAQHRALVPIIVPAKTTVYRDAVPARWTRDPGAPRPGDEIVYRAMRRALDAHHVRYVDARELLTTSPEPRELLWPKTGRHWTQYAACQALARVAPIFSELTGRPLDIECQLRRVRGPIYDDDYDLRRLLNAWWVDRPFWAMQTAPQPPLSGARPTAIFIGTSFCWHLLRVATRSQQLDASMDYYDSTLISGPNYIASDLRATPTAWREALLGKDLYVIDLFETYVGAPGAHLDQFPDELAHELDTP